VEFPDSHEPNFGIAPTCCRPAGNRNYESGTVAHFFTPNASPRKHESVIAERRTIHFSARARIGALRNSRASESYYSIELRARIGAHFSATASPWLRFLSPCPQRLRRASRLTSLHRNSCRVLFLAPSREAEARDGAFHVLFSLLFYFSLLSRTRFYPQRSNSPRVLLQAARLAKRAFSDRNILGRRRLVFTILSPEILPRLTRIPSRISLGTFLPPVNVGLRLSGT